MPTDQQPPKRRPSKRNSKKAAADAESSVAVLAETHTPMEEQILENDKPVDEAQAEEFPREAGDDEQPSVEAVDAAEGSDEEMSASAAVEFEAEETVADGSGLELFPASEIEEEEDSVLFSEEEIESADDIELEAAEAGDEDAEITEGSENAAEGDETTELADEAAPDEEYFAGAASVAELPGVVSEADVLAQQEEVSADAPINTEAAVAALAAAAAQADLITAEDAAEEVPNYGAHDPGIDGELLAADAAAGEEEGEAPPAFRPLEGSDLQAAVEATFFMHHKPISVSKLRELINPKIHEEEYRTAVSNLMASYFDDSRGIELAEVAGGYQFRTKSVHKDIMRRMYQIAPMKLTNAMLEVLAISAYNQPITREGIDRVRGVDSSHLVRVLLDKKMLRIVGKSDELGRPMLYGTTKEFLEVFGLRDLTALPSLREIEDMLPKNEVGAEISEEEMLAKEMEGIVENSKPLEFNDLELEELEANETQKVQGAAGATAKADGDGSPSLDGSPQGGEETGGDFNLPAEVAGRFPLGPEGNA